MASGEGKVGVRERQFADQVGETWFGCGAGGSTDEADAHGCERFPVDVAAAKSLKTAVARRLVPREDVEVSLEDEDRAVLWIRSLICRVGADFEPGQPAPVRERKE